MQEFVTISVTFPHMLGAGEYGTLPSIEVAEKLLLEKGWEETDNSLQFAKVVKGKGGGKPHIARIQEYFLTDVEALP